MLRNNTSRFARTIHWRLQQSEFGARNFLEQFRQLKIWAGTDPFFTLWLDASSDWALSFNQMRVPQFSYLAGGCIGSL